MVLTNKILYKVANYPTRMYRGKVIVVVIVVVVNKKKSPDLDI